VTVLWPGGEREAYGDFASGRGYALRQGEGSDLAE